MRHGRPRRLARPLTDTAGGALPAAGRFSETSRQTFRKAGRNHPEIVSHWYAAEYNQRNVGPGVAPHLIFGSIAVADDNTIITEGADEAAQAFKENGQAADAGCMDACRFDRNARS
jgi:hypothetical protein